MPFAAFNRANRLRGSLWLLKNVVLLVNVLSLIAGAAMTAVGLYGFMNKNIVGIVSETLPLACVMLGVVVALVSCVGCCGAANESKVFLKLYIGLLVLLVVAQISIGAVAFTHKDDVEFHLSNWWKLTFENERKDLTQIEEYFNCCGFKALDDMPGAASCPTTATPCYQKLRAAFVSSSYSLATAAVSLGFIELLCLIAACIFISLAHTLELSRDTSLLEEARKLQKREAESSKTKRYNFDTPFDDAEDGDD